METELKLVNLNKDSLDFDTIFQKEELLAKMEILDIIAEWENDIPPIYTDNTYSLTQVKELIDNVDERDEREIYFGILKHNEDFDYIYIVCKRNDLKYLTKYHLQVKIYIRSHTNIYPRNIYHFDTDKSWKLYGDLIPSFVSYNNLYYTTLDNLYNFCTELHKIILLSHNSYLQKIKSKFT